MLSRWQAYTWTSFGGRCWEVRSQSGSQVREGLFLYGNPPGEVHPAPERIYLAESGTIEQFLVPASGDRNQHTLQREPLAIDLLPAIAVAFLHPVVILDHHGIEVSRSAKDLLDQEERSACHGVLPDVA